MNSLLFSKDYPFPLSISQYPFPLILLFQSSNDLFDFKKWCNNAFKGPLIIYLAVKPLPTMYMVIYKHFGLYYFWEGYVVAINNTTADKNYSANNNIPIILLIKRIIYINSYMCIYYIYLYAAFRLFLSQKINVLHIWRFRENVI